MRNKKYTNAQNFTKHLIGFLFFFGIFSAPTQSFAFKSYLSTEEYDRHTFKDNNFSSPNTICDVLQVQQSNGVITITGGSSQIVSVQFFDKNDNWKVKHQTFYTNQASINISTIPTGYYAYKIDIYSTSWVYICTKEGNLIQILPPTLPIVSINDQSIDENAGLASAIISLSKPVTQPLSLKIVSADITALAGMDYIRIDTTIVIPIGSDKASVNIRLIDDLLAEQSESFKISVSGQIAPNSKSSATISINANDNDTNPCGQLAIQVNANNINITGLSSPIYILQIFDKDWNKLSSSYVGASTGTSCVIENLAVGKYYVKVDLLNANWTKICTEEGFYEVMDGGDLPTLSINDVTVDELSQQVQIQVNLSEPATNPVSVDIATFDSTAMNGRDYTAFTGTITIPIGEVSSTFTIPIILDTNTEFAEIFIVKLSNPSNALLTNTQNIITIVDDYNDPLYFSIPNSIIVDEKIGTAVIVAELSRPAPINAHISIIVGYGNATATYGSDYYFQQVNFTFPQGHTTIEIKFDIIDDLIQEDNENFEIIVEGSFTPFRQFCGVTILDDDANPCDNITINPSFGSINISGMSGNNNSVQMFDADWQLKYECYFNACTSPNTVIPNVLPGRYFVKAQNLSSNWEVICKKEQYVDVVSNKIASTNNLPFQANKKGQAVQLQWTSNTGERNDYFSIERSTDGQFFEKIGEKSAEGIADEMLYFSEIDNTPQTGDNYYRLRLVYLDGSELLSEVQKVHFSDSKDFVLYPNPARDRVFLDASAFEGISVQVQIINALGRMIYSEVIQKNNQDQLDIDLSTLESGVFNVICTGENGYRVAKTLVVDDLK